MSRVRLWTLDAECPACDKRPFLRLTKEGRDAWAALADKTTVAEATCGASGCGTSYLITSRAVKHGQEVRGLSLVGETVVEVPDICPAPGPHLSPRQQEVYAGVIAGKTDARMARDMGLSPWTVRKYMIEGAERLRAEREGLPTTSPRRTILAHYSGGVPAGPRLVA